MFILALIAALVFFRPTSCRLILNTAPDNADVSLDEVFQGKTPLVLKNVAPGDRKLKIELPGYVPEEFIVPVQPGSEVLTRMIQLVPVEPSTPQLGTTQGLKLRDGSHDHN
jgi:hypothetical protein